MRGRSESQLSLFRVLRRALAPAGVIGLLAVAPSCNSLTGAEDLAVGPSLPSDGVLDGGIPDAAAPDALDPPDASRVPTPAYGLDGWSFRRPVVLASDEMAPLVKHAVLVVIPPTFDYSHASPNADDLRFTTDVARADELPYFVEDWTPGGTSHVWVSVPNVPSGPSLLHVFYGKPSAAPVSSFGSTFPNARRTSGGGAGSFVATGDIDVDWFELRAGDTLTLAAGVPLRISARRILIAGMILGTGKGSPGGALPMAAGTGPGGGMIVAGSGAGGGGHGGVGGRGGSTRAEPAASRTARWRASTSRWARAAARWTASPRGRAAERSRSSAGESP